MKESEIVRANQLPDSDRIEYLEYLISKKETQTDYKFQLKQHDRMGWNILERAVYQMTEILHYNVIFSGGSLEEAYNARNQFNKERNFPSH